MVSKLESYMTTVDSFAYEWNDFKRALRGEDKDAFDNLMIYAKRHPQGLRYAFPLPFEPIIMRILLEQEKQIRNLWMHVKKD